MQPKSIALSQSGNRLAALLVQQGDGTASTDDQKQWIQVWDVDTGEVDLPTRTALGRWRSLTAVIDPSGTQLLLYSRFDDSVFHQQQCELVELPSGKVLWKRPSEGSKFGFKCWSQDGSVIVVVESTPEQPQGSLQLWDASSGEDLCSFPSALDVASEPLGTTSPFHRTETDWRS